MTRPTIRRLFGLEKQAATVMAAVQHPPIPPLAERRGWTLQQHMELWERVRRGEYSVSPEEVDGRRTWDLKGKSVEELADIYGQMRQETNEEIRRELDSW